MNFPCDTRSAGDLAHDRYTAITRQPYFPERFRGSSEKLRDSVASHVAPARYLFLSIGKMLRRQQAPESSQTSR
jgi:hypothetical protein